MPRVTTADTSVGALGVGSRVPVIATLAANPATPLGGGRTIVMTTRAAGGASAYGHIWPEGYYPALPYGWNLETGEGTALPIPNGYVEAFVWDGRGSWLVGHANDPDGETFAVAWNLGDGGAATVLGSPPGSTVVQAFGVAGRWALGYCSDGHVGWDLSDPSTPILLSPPGDSTPVVYVYSGSGTGLVAGWAESDGSQFPFLWDLADGGAYIALGVPDGYDNAGAYNVTDQWAVGWAHATGDPVYSPIPVMWNLASPESAILLGGSDAFGFGEAVYVQGTTIVGYRDNVPENTGTSWLIWDATDPSSYSVGATYRGLTYAKYQLDVPWYTGQTDTGEALFNTTSPSSDDLVSAGYPQTYAVGGNWVGGICLEDGGVELPIAWNVASPDNPIYLPLPDGYVYGTVYAVIVP